jgi:hypothetical protein
MQGQAELLLEHSINHYRGGQRPDANGERLARPRSATQTCGLPLFDCAQLGRSSCARGVSEIVLARRDVEKDAASMDRLGTTRFGEQGPRANALWDIALLGNRGIEPQRAAQILLASIHDPNVNIRYWAVEGLAYLGTDETIAPLLQAFHDDSSPMIRERAACGLA